MTIPIATLVAAILSTAPRVAPDRADYLARGILAASRGDLDRTAALVVIGRRESTWRRDVERCGVEGIGGWGAFGVANIEPWRRLYPGGTCGPIERQAYASAEIWGLHWRTTGGSARSAFGRYIGATAGGRHPEARLRAEMFWRIRASLECACSS